MRQFVFLALILTLATAAAGEPENLRREDCARYVQQFNAMEAETVVNLIPNDQAEKWMAENIPLLDCPDKLLEETYYFRWWSFRKHIRQTPGGRVVTEFLQPVNHAGAFNTIADAFGHHVAEGRWLRDQKLLDEYATFWFRSGPNNSPAEHFHNFSSWAAAALYERYLVTGDAKFVMGLLDDLIFDYGRWESERQRPDGLFWQYDVRDGMEESISGGRKEKNARPTINVYMAANALAIGKIAQLAGRANVAQQFAAKGETLRQKMTAALWDKEAKFFKVQFEQGGLSDAREEIGYIPWMFHLAEPAHAEAWRQLKDPAGFASQFGITTAERRHPQFRSHGTGKCEWDGPVWPFATSQTLTGLAHVLRGPEQSVVTRRDYFDALITYTRSQQQDGKPYIGEYLDETDGHWLITGPKAERSRYYNHSTFADLVITGLAGLVPRDDEIIEVDPLLPTDAWDWFCLDHLNYHGRTITLLWDRTGGHYGRGAGFFVSVDGQVAARGETLGRVTAAIHKPTSK